MVDNAQIVELSSRLQQLIERWERQEADARIVGVSR